MRLARILELNDSLRGTAHQTGVIDHARRALDIGDEQHNIDEEEDENCREHHHEQAHRPAGFLGDRSIHKFTPPNDKSTGSTQRAGIHVRSTLPDDFSRTGIKESSTR